MINVSKEQCITFVNVSLNCEKILRIADREATVVCGNNSFLSMWPLL